jgi:hypothetical protein
MGIKGLRVAPLLDSSLHRGYTSQFLLSLRQIEIE